jgi:hypothetical protein
MAGKEMKEMKEVIFNEETYLIPLVRKGVILSDEEKMNVAEVVCMMYETDEYSLEECLQYCGIRSKSTWWNWVNNVEPIERLYLKAQKMKDLTYSHGLKRRARTLVERLLDGGIIQDLEEQEAEPVIGPGNERRLVTVKVKRKQVLIKPSAGLILSILYNHDPALFDKNPEPIEQMSKELSIEPIEWVE